MAPAFVDHVLNRASEDEPRLLELARLGALETFGDAQRPEAVPDVLVDDHPRLINLRGEWTEVAAKQRAQHHRAREAHHLLGDVHWPSVRRHRLPLVRGLTRRLCHDTGQPRDTLAMERWLRDATLPQPEVVFAGQQPIADRRAQLLI